VPAEWPPEHNDDASRDWFRSMIEERPEESGYGAWYVVAGGRVIGTAGYKGPPDAVGEVEIGYSLVPSAQGQGHAAAAAALLAARAFRDPRVTAVLAETLPHLDASQRVLARNGFAANGSYIDPDEGEILRFRLPRAA
jgi:[ribosomal protein S5]-alanine N-acetyltransferase